jgi:pyruvate/2-oxoglutarate dehydrogenase complex dihydrolipoamide acyltransferase (E2) component
MMRACHESGHSSTYRTKPFPKLRRALAATYDVVQRTHKVHGLIEVDVTDARSHLRRHEEQTGERLSFTAFVIACLARAVDENKVMNACRKGPRRLAFFDDVDVATAIERESQGRKQPIVYSVRGANRKSFRAIHQEIRAAQVATVESAWTGFEFERTLIRAPMFALRGLWAAFWWARSRYPRLQKKYGGTVGLSAVGMFGHGGGWAIPISYHTLDVTLGGIATKPGIVDGRIAIREYLAITLSFDHDIIDGAPAARFAARLRELIESGYGLHEDVTTSAQPTPTYV